MKSGLRYHAMSLDEVWPAVPLHAVHHLVGSQAAVELLPLEEALDRVAARPWLRQEIAADLDLPLA